VYVGEETWGNREGQGLGALNRRGEEVTQVRGHGVSGAGRGQLLTLATTPASCARAGAGRWNMQDKVKLGQNQVEREGANGLGRLNPCAG
jgi:hypothetical protein